MNDRYLARLRRAAEPGPPRGAHAVFDDAKRDALGGRHLDYVDSESHTGGRRSKLVPVAFIAVAALIVWGAVLANASKSPSESPAAPTLDDPPSTTDPVHPPPPRGSLDVPSLDGHAQEEQYEETEEG